MPSTDGKLAIASLGLLEGLMFLQALLAHSDSFLTVGQMQGRGIVHGMPFLWHLAMLGDAVIVAPLVSYVVLRYGRLWNARTIGKSLALAICATSVMHWLYMQGTVPGVHIYDRSITPAGVVHFIFMACALTVFSAFFFSTPEASPMHVVTTSALLLAHVFLGTHLALGLIKRYWDLDWYPPDPLLDPQAWLTFVGVALILVWRSRQIMQRPIGSSASL